MGEKAVQAEKWLTIIGIGEDGIAGLGDAAKAEIAKAKIIYGGTRHLALMEGLITGEQRIWPSPFEKGMAEIAALRGTQICVLASGDPFFYGVGATLARSINPREMHVIAHPSAFSLAAARLGWPLQSVEQVSLHGRAIELVRPLLHPGRRVLALTSDAQGPSVLAAYLTEHGFGLSVMTVLEAVGGPREKRSQFTANAFPVEAVIDQLNLVAIDVVAEPDAQILPLGAGLADDLFEHDGQITKRAQRAVTLSSLAPRRGELLWDIGAGSGSVAIAWMLTDPSMRAICIEENPKRAASLTRNAVKFGVPGIALVEASAPQAFAGLETPDAIFIGGGGSEDGVLEGAVAALKQGGRLVANAVTLEMEALLLAAHAKRGGELIRIAVTTASPVGTMHGWRPAMPVTQWSWVKP
ncbi:precorrin-6y C5,15-methyltransferase (decarboxylating) subunit CbiE [Mesorhizobium sp. NBSH29]|uniref:precorrin-6y C5,15-methyltransferase (decarboxylating) subunit CbiE n=1 Tax=Mesorhizobium sp. NBSH29 TaxID=2654249 RepID=UPI0018968C0C|nr:precorrin-6y C5,15-methyltransferase (decarboxylating) subunit CbiE [Mesorhizobium sp. NBSH29]QPC86652.1 precorrin-6y C5,15-methyltransferase (decarboxylating) subunit CbiE [Mesorhizobium sp. NBSH29]